MVGVFIVFEAQKPVDWSEFKSFRYLSTSKLILLYFLKVLRNTSICLAM